MCNFYRIDQKPGKDQRVRVRIAAAAGKLASPLVRKSDPGIVLLTDGRVEVTPCENPLTKPKDSGGQRELF